MPHLLLLYFRAHSTTPAPFFHLRIFEDYVAAQNAVITYNYMYGGSHHLLGNKNAITNFTRICGLAHNAMREARGE
eukprot:5857579-Pleurochrysis_carterae.AAC.1